MESIAIVSESMFKIAQRFMNPKIAEEEDELERKRKLKGAILFRGEKELIKIFYETDQNIVCFKETDVNDKFDYVQETKLANGKFRYEVIPGEIRFPRSDDKNYTIKIPRLKNGKKSDKHFDIVTLNKEGELIDAKLASVGVMQLDEEWLRERGAFEDVLVGKRCVVPGGPAPLDVIGISRAAGDGNCGFRSILGGNYLNGDINRIMIVDHLRDEMNNRRGGDIKRLINNDITALYQEWALDQNKVIPDFIRDRFLEQQANDIPRDGEPQGEYEQRRELDFNMLVNNDESRNSYLNEYLIHNHNWPHPQGSLIAYAKIQGVKLYCWQNNGEDNLRLVDNVVDVQNWKHPNGDVHILQNVNHFDRLEVAPNHFREREEARREAAAIAPRVME